MLAALSLRWPARVHSAPAAVGVMKSRKLNRVGRLLIGLLGPAIVGSFIIMVFVFVSAVIKEGPSIEIFHSVLKGFVIFLAVGSIFFGLQSLVYTVLMEFVVRPRIRLRTAYLVVSCILGAASGLIIDTIFDDFPFLTIVGATTGLLMGLIMYDKNMQSSHKKTHAVGTCAS